MAFERSSVTLFASQGATADARRVFHVSFVLSIGSSFFSSFCSRAAGDRNEDVSFKPHFLRERYINANEKLL